MLLLYIYIYIHTYTYIYIYIYEQAADRRDEVAVRGYPEGWHLGRLSASAHLYYC